MITFFGEPSLKQAVRNRVAKHRRLDQIAQGVYWSNDRGCFIGCSLHSSKHSDFERLLGLPEWLARAGEWIFEDLPKAQALDFPLALYDAIPVGADLEPARTGLIRWAMEDFCAKAKGEHSVRAAKLWRRMLDGDRPRLEEWQEAYRAALDAIDALDASDALYAFAALAALDAFDARDARDARAALAALDVRDSIAQAAAAKLIELVSACAPVEHVKPELPSDPYFEAYRVQVMAEALEEIRKLSALGDAAGIVRRALEWTAADEVRAAPRGSASQEKP